MNSKFLAIFGLLALVQFAAARQALCYVTWLKDGATDTDNCYFPWRNSTECLEAREYMYKQMSCRYQNSLRSCSTSIRVCTESKYTFARRCRDIRGISSYYDSIRNLPAGNCTTT